DESATAPDGVKGTLVADLCVPIFDDGHRVIGVTKISLDATWMLQQINLQARPDELQRTMWLVREDGKAVPGARPAPPVPALPDHVTGRLQQHAVGWTKDDDLANYEVIGYAAVEQSKIIEKAGERWH